MKKMKSKDDVQKALDYTMYMMISGNFEKCISKSRIEEKKLFLHYCELPTRKREAIEDNCAYLADVVLMDSGVLPITIWDETVQSYFLKGKDISSVAFFGKGWKLEITGFYRSEKKQGFSISFISKDGEKKGNVLLPASDRISRRRKKPAADSQPVYSNLAA